MMQGAFIFAGKGLSPLRGKVTENKHNVLLTDHLYPMMKNSYPDGSGLIQDDSAHIRCTGGMTGCFDQDENEVNQMLWPSQLTNLNRIEDFEIFGAAYSI